jgi:hypothetical protein
MVDALNCGVPPPSPPADAGNEEDLGEGEEFEKLEAILNRIQTTFSSNAR